MTDYVENHDLPNAYFNEEELHKIYNSVNVGKSSIKQEFN
jgi:hypothetical protein